MVEVNPIFTIRMWNFLTSFPGTLSLNHTQFLPSVLDFVPLCLYGVGICFFHCSCFPICGSLGFLIAAFCLIYLCSLGDQVEICLLFGFVDIISAQTSNFLSILSCNVFFTSYSSYFWFSYFVSWSVFLCFQSSLSYSTFFLSLFADYICQTAFTQGFPPRFLATVNNFCYWGRWQP